MKGIVGVSAWNLVIVGTVAVVAVMVFNMFAAGKSVGGYTIPRA